MNAAATAQRREDATADRPAPGRGPARRLARAYREACALDVLALKPGNVGWGRPGHGMTAADFLRSAAVSADPLTAPGRGLGARVSGAVAATRRAVGCNTNLGIILLCAPLLQAAQAPGHGTRGLRRRLGLVLETAERTDMDGINSAIRLAAPGGLGTEREHDVSAPASAAPRAVMAAAAARDRIARQYAECFADLFGRALPLYRRLLRRWCDPAWAATAVYLDLLGRFPDTHIARKLGRVRAHAVSRRIAPIAAALSRAGRPERHRAALRTLDRRLRTGGVNPGTSADLTVACLLIDRLVPGGTGHHRRRVTAAIRHPGVQCARPRYRQSEEPTR